MCMTTEDCRIDYAVGEDCFRTVMELSVFNFWQEFEIYASSIGQLSHCEEDCHEEHGYC